MKTQSTPSIEIYPLDVNVTENNSSIVQENDTSYPVNITENSTANPITNSKFSFTPDEYVFSASLPSKGFRHIERLSSSNTAILNYDYCHDNSKLENPDPHSTMVTCFKPFWVPLRITSYPFYCRPTFPVSQFCIPTIFQL